MDCAQGCQHRFDGAFMPRGHVSLVGSKTVYSTRVQYASNTTYTNSKVISRVGAHLDPLVQEMTEQVGKTGVPCLRELLRVAESNPDTVVALGQEMAWESVLGTVVPYALAHAILLVMTRLHVGSEDSSGAAGFAAILSTGTSCIRSICKSIVVFFPVYAVMRLLTIGFSVAHVLYVSSGKAAQQGFVWHQAFLFNQRVPDIVYWMAQIAQDGCEILVILFVLMTILRVKDTLLTEIQYSLQAKRKKDTSIGIDRLIGSIKNITSVFGWMVALYAALIAIGINPMPIFTSLGASSIIVGLAAQPLIANIVSGVAIYSSRCLLTGDHVELLSAGGGVVVSGIVEVVSPTTCVIRDDEDCLIYVNNSQMSSMILRNKSQTVVM